MFSSTMMQLAM